jgi:hypothetical protein
MYQLFCRMPTHMPQHAALLWHTQADILQMEPPELYVRQNPTPNAYTLAISGRKPFIVVHTSLLELLTPRELQAVLAHGEHIGTHIGDDTDTGVCSRGWQHCGTRVGWCCAGLVTRFGRQTRVGWCCAGLVTCIFALACLPCCMLAICFGWLPVCLTAC